MNDLTVVLATLTDAIESYQSRPTDLDPIEKLKLKALRLNLEVARGALDRAGDGAVPQLLRPARSPEQEKFYDRLRRLRAHSAKTRAETSALVAEMYHQVTRARALCEAIRTTVEQG